MFRIVLVLSVPLAILVALRLVSPLRWRKASVPTDALPLYAGHDTSSGVKVSNGPVRRNQIAEDKFSPVRARMKEV